MTLDYANRYVLPAAFALLPARMDTSEARAMLLAIGAQESRLTERWQQHGPARGYWQFEPIGLSGVLSHPKSRPHALDVCAALDYRGVIKADVLADNDVLACCFARLLLWTLPDALPGREERGKGWAQYLAAWRPGRPRIESWSDCWTRAWAAVGESTAERMTGTAL